MAGLFNKERPITLHQYKFFDGHGLPYTAFIAATDPEWKAFEEGGRSNLEPMRRSILLLVKGHNPSPEEQASAKRVFLNFYASIRPWTATHEKDALEQPMLTPEEQEELRQSSQKAMQEFRRMKKRLPREK